MTQKVNISKNLKLVLRICFYLNILMIILLFTFPLFVILDSKLNLGIDIFLYFKFFGYFSLPVATLWFYCIYFYYKFDKYSSSGIKILLFGYFYAPIYFYKVIWKQKRQLINSYESEPVLGNTIHLETYETNDK